MSELITVPTFTFSQGKPGDDVFESPIHVDFYNGCIVLRQDGEYTQQEQINILPQHLDALFREIKKHRPEAEHFLTK
jgi:hypothetical protein